DHVRIGLQTGISGELRSDPPAFRQLFLLGQVDNPLKIGTEDHRSEAERRAGDAGKQKATHGESKTPARLKVKTNGYLVVIVAEHETSVASPGHVAASHVRGRCLCGATSRKRKTPSHEPQRAAAPLAGSSYSIWLCRRDARQHVLAAVHGR